MSEDDDEFECMLGWIEREVLKQPLTADQRAHLHKEWVSGRLSAMALSKFRRRLKSRQGSKMPDFEALYRYKSELDKKLNRGD